MKPLGHWEPWPYSIRDMMIYTYRRLTGQLRKFPEVKGMSYNQYRKNYLSRWVSEDS